MGVEAESALFSRRVSVKSVGGFSFKAPEEGAFICVYSIAFTSI